MKKTFYAFLLNFVVFGFVSSKATAQYHITSIVIDSTTLPGCGDSALFYVNTNTGSSSSYYVVPFFNGINSTIYSTTVGPTGTAAIALPVSFPGSYTSKFVLYDRWSNPIDSAVQGFAFDSVCSFLPISIFNDVLGTGIYNDARDPLNKLPVSVQVRHNGIITDTISCTSGFYYSTSAPVGDVYSFKIISALPAGMSLVFPSSGIIHDTISSYPNSYPINYFGVRCAGTSSFDLAVNATVPVTGIHDQSGNIYVSNASCFPADATVTLNFSPKYAYRGGAQPIPFSASGNTITWNLTGLSTVSSRPIDLYYQVWDVAGDLVAGDTVHEAVKVTPTAGGVSDVEIIVDTVLAGVDPNEMSVSPSGYITAGTTLKYTINFENTGTDTAYNISVYDTLSDNVNPQSLNIVMASAVMNIAMLNQGGHNIVKFDFPNINLLDSANHGLCNGAVIFTVNTLPGLPDGTTIFNHAGIFFDYNPVVMTNTVEDIIGTPSLVATISNPSAIALYPNPASTSITILSTNQPINQVTVTNLVGQTLCNNQYNSKQIQINVSTFPSGIYFVKVNGNEVRKFVKE